VVEILLGQGQSPHSFDPSPRSLARLGEARLFFRAGVPYENRISAKLASAFGALNVVDTRRGIALRHVDEDDHGHEGDDPHTWLDPKLVKIQAATIHEALAAADPAGEQIYRANLANYMAALDSLDSELTALLAPYRGRTVYVYHPAFGYFLDSYGLHQAAVQSGGHEPAARELAELMDRMRAEGVRTLFVQPEFPSPVADALQRALGCRVVRLDPLAENYITNLRKMGRLVAESLAGEQ
jgi:zinc transport system substrate-binding protein